jgi:hypothetical protein
MPVRQYAARYAQRRLVSKAARAIPWLGAALAAAAIASTIRRKGLIHGTLDSALTALPVVGAMKYAVEAVRGRDIFPDRPRRDEIGPMLSIDRPPAVSHG